MKKIIIFLICLFLSVEFVRAECITILGAGSGNKSEAAEESGACGGNLCARTAIFTKNGNFSEEHGTSAIYGFRISLKGTSGKWLKRNVWATDKMRQYVVNTVKKKGNYYDNLDKRFDYYVENIGLDSYGKKDNDPGLSLIDNSSSTYADYIKDVLTKEDNLNKVLYTVTKKSHNDKYKDINALMELNITEIKIEPIYVLYVLGSSVSKPFYIEGTAQEVYNKGKKTIINTNGIMKGDDWHIIDNFLKTVYQGDTATSKTGWYAKADDKKGGVGYLNLGESCIKKGSVTISKKQVNSELDYNNAVDFQGCASFALKNIDKNKVVKNFELGQNCSTKNNSIKIDDLPLGKYLVEETNATNDVYTYLEDDANGASYLKQKKKQFTISKNKSERKVNFYNVFQEEKSCNSELEKIKNLDNSLAKDKLKELFNDYPYNDNLLNFDDNTNIKTAIENGTISCSSKITEKKKPIVSKECSETFIGFTDNPSLSEYSSPYTRYIAQELYDDYEKENQYCYVNYKFNFSKNIINTKANIRHSSFLWPSENGLVGNLEAIVHCEGGDVSKLNSERMENVVAKAFKGISLVKDEKTVQSIIIADNTSFKSNNKGEYQLTYDLKYATSYWADRLSGRISNNTFGLSLGYGIPLKIKDKDGSILFNYTFNNSTSDSNSIANFYSSLEPNLSVECPYKKEYGELKVRETNLNNMFSNKTGGKRSVGANWNSCYNALSNVIGKYYDEFMYGDINNDQKIDDRDANAYDSLISDDKKVYADVNKDGKIDGEDKELLNLYLSNSNIQFQSTSDILNKCNDYNMDNQVIETVSTKSLTTPLYSFTISPKDINAIREYNKQYTYSNSKKLSCNYDGCISQFITDLIDKKISITNITGSCINNKTGFERLDCLK